MTDASSMLPATPSDPPPKANPGRLRLALAALLFLAGTLAIRAMPALDPAARAALLVALAALLAWAVLRWSDTPVALAAALALVALEVVPATTLFASLGHPIIWLMLGAFVLSATLRASGVANRLLHQALGAGGRRFDRLCWQLTALTAATALVIPSTSARAALLLPVYLGLVPHLSPPQARALALLFPSVILLSAGGVLLGAGAHLVTVDFVQAQGGTPWNWLDWARLAAPFALGSCLLATAIILRGLPRHERRAWLPALPAASPAPWSPQQRRIAAITAVAVLAWAVGPRLGLDPALTALCAALAATTARWTGISLGDALRQVEWNLLLFMAATLVLGQALLGSGAAATLAAGLMRQLDVSQLPSGACTPLPP